MHSFGLTKKSVAVLLPKTPNLVHEPRVSARLAEVTEEETEIEKPTFALVEFATLAEIGPLPLADCGATHALEASHAARVSTGRLPSAHQCALRDIHVFLQALVSSSGSAFKAARE